MKVVLIGSGNLAHHLGHSFLKNGINVLQIVGRSSSSAKKLAKSLHCTWTTDPAEIDLSADVYLFAVADHDLPEAISGLHALRGKTVVHTSGTVPVSIFPRSFKHAGVFWPVQTLTVKGKLKNYHFPVCIESRSPISRLRLRRLSKAIGCRPVEMSSKDREWLHLTAVMANNFSNHLYSLTDQLLKKRGMSFELLKPLIRETVSKIDQGPPTMMQTGPAKRGDTSTISRHLELLSSNGSVRQLYGMLSKSIQETHGNTL